MTSSSLEPTHATGQADSAPLKLGVSSCLLGNPVRYDGGHKRDRYLTDVLGRHVSFVPVCPEVECGLGVPREAMRLVGNPDDPRLITVKTGVDLTDRMTAWAKPRLEELAGQDLCGFVFKSRSPSSGMERVKVYGKGGVPVNKGVGVFARLFMKRFPWLPVEEEGRLNDPVLRENFIERLFVFKRWRDSVLGVMTPEALMDFHSRHKLLFMAHNQEKLRSLGRLVARRGEIPIGDAAADYQETMTQLLARPATVARQRNVLLHAMGYFKKRLDPDEKQELLELIERYAGGLLPLIVPITMINHFVRKYREPYLSGQWWLSPHPVELALRNHV